MRRNILLALAILLGGSLFAQQTATQKIISGVKSKTKSGLFYKIIPSTKPSPLLHSGQIVKFNVVTRLNDSVLFSTHGRVPAYSLIQKTSPPYSIMEVFPKLKNGDSSIFVQSADSLMKKQPGNLPPFVKPGDKIITSIRILKVFQGDSSARADYMAEMEKDRPRREQEQAEQRAAMKKEQDELKKMTEEAWKASGEIDREFRAMDSFLTAKKITATRTGRGTYVVIRKQGDGPVADSLKYITVRYVGKFLETDSTFESNTYTFQLGMGGVIDGWEEGLRLFRKGGEGTLYVPGFLAYGDNPPAGSPFKPFEALIFDVVVEDVKDKP